MERQTRKHSQKAKSKLNARKTLAMMLWQKKHWNDVLQTIWNETISWSKFATHPESRIIKATFILETVIRSSLSQLAESLPPHQFVVRRAWKILSKYFHWWSAGPNYSLLTFQGRYLCVEWVDEWSPLGFRQASGCDLQLLSRVCCVQALSPSG